MTDFRLEEIALSDLTAIDLRAEAELAGALAGAYDIIISDKAERAQALVVPDAADGSSGRIGIAWGADAQWGDVSHIWAPENGIRDGDESGHLCDGFHGITDAIADWLDDEDAWEARA